jgi:ABC-type antimicrobial peptide transport system permease subunit
MFGIRGQRDSVIKAELSWYLFAGSVFMIMLTIAVCTILQTWRAANENPARSIKSE